jgi:acyl carrier protein phosphodiesterase
MNFLAHAYLCRHDNDLMIGSMAGDFVKGDIFSRYSGNLAQGLWLHRKVDSWCDTHPACRASRARVSPARRRYAGVMIDVFYDHLLSQHWKRYCATPLPRFIEEVHDTLDANLHRLPGDFARVAPLMMEQGWLASYGCLEGIASTLTRMGRRLSRVNPLPGSAAELVDHYSEMEEDFLAFFPDCIAYVEQLADSTETGANCV